MRDNRERMKGKTRPSPQPIIDYTQHSQCFSSSYLEYYQCFYPLCIILLILILPVIVTLVLLDKNYKIPG